MRKNKVVYISIALVTVAFLLLINTCNNEKGYVLEKSLPTEQYVYPPFDSALVERRIFDVKTSQGAELMFGTTKITIPRYAFIDKDGSVVKGEVKLAYREVMDPTSILMSGVPMETSEGSGKYFESGGMMEMIAWKGENMLHVNPKSKIKVNMQSSYSGEDYNLYSLDTVNRQWIKRESNLMVEPIRKLVEEEYVSIEFEEPNYDVLAQTEGVVNPIVPVAKDKELFQFKFKTDFSQYPELNIYNGVQWEFSGTNKSEDPAQNSWVMNAIWNEMEIVKRKNNGVYKLRLVSGDREFNTSVKPVFDEQDMEYAEYVFNQNYDKYREFVRKKKEEAKKWRLNQEKLARERAQQQQVYTLSGQFSREFEVMGFGWTNIDRIYESEHQKILASFKFNNGKKVSVDRVYLFLDSVNSVQTFYKNNLTEFTFYRKRDNKLIVIDSLADAYIVQKEEFNKINLASNQHVFVLGDAITIDSEEDIRALLFNSNI